MAQEIYFTSDLHFGHKNILLHCPERAKVGGFELGDVEAHDKWLIEKWNSRINKTDIVYILGDFSFGSSDYVKKLIGQLHGFKFLILGNHDSSSENLTNYFKQITQIKHVTFRKSVHDFLEEDFQVSMCHYPMVTWVSKHYGCVQLHGHCHGRLDDYNSDSTDLRVDVGIDGKLANFDFLTLKQVYEYMKSKTNGEILHKYAMQKKEERNMVI